MTKAKTQLAQPFWPAVTAKPKGKKTAAGTVRHAQIESGEELKICSDPPPRTTLGPRTSKYADIFESLEIGKGLECSSEKASVVATAMRTWIKKTGREGVGVVSMSDYGDGKGRVWLIATEKEATE